jgi:hypothetical protein
MYRDIMEEVEKNKQWSTAELIKRLEGQIPVGAPQQTKVLNLLGSNLDAEELEQKFKPPKNKKKNAEIIELEKILISELKQKLGILNEKDSKQVLKVPISDLKNFSNLIINEFIGTKNKLSPGVSLLSVFKPLPLTQFGEKLEENIIYRPEVTGLSIDDSKRINKLAEKLGMIVNDYAIRFEDIIVTIDKLRDKLLKYLGDFETLGTTVQKNNRVKNKDILNSLNYPKFYKSLSGPDQILKNLLGSNFYKLSEEESKRTLLAPILENFKQYTPEQVPVAENLQRYYKKYNKDRFQQSLQTGTKPVGIVTDENLKLYYYDKENQLGESSNTKTNNRFHILKVNPLTQFMIAGLQSLDRIKDRTIKYKEFFEFDRKTLGNQVKASNFDRRNLFAGCFRTFNKFQDASVFMIIFLRAFLKQTSKTMKEIEILIEQQPESERIAYKALMNATFPFYNSSLATQTQ